MITLKQFIAGLNTIPIMTSWYLADISKAKGRQELYKRQPPQNGKQNHAHGVTEDCMAPALVQGVCMAREIFILD